MAASIYDRVDSAFSEIIGLTDRISKIDDLLKSVIGTLEKIKREELSSEAADSLADVITDIQTVRLELF